MALSEASTELGEDIMMRNEDQSPGNPSLQVTFKSYSPVHHFCREDSSSEELVISCSFMKRTSIYS
jgi:hypothetical protein